MNEKHPIRRPYRPNVRCQLMFKSHRTAGILMAGPFVICFALFGVFNLIAGSILTMMACKPKFSQQTIILIEKLFKNHNQKQETFLDPMKVVGTILLITGSLLVLVGILLGIVACRSTNFQNRRRGSGASFSGIQMSSVNGPTSFGALSTVGNTASNRLRSLSVLVSERKRPQESPSPSDLKTAIADIHNDDVSFSANGGPPHHSVVDTEDSELKQDGKVSIVTYSEDTVSKNNDNPAKKVCVVTWAADTSSLKSKNSVLEDSEHAETSGNS